MQRFRLSYFANILALFFGLVICYDLLCYVSWYLVIALKAHLIAASALCHLTYRDGVVKELCLRSFGEYLLFAACERF